MSSLLTWATGHLDLGFCPVPTIRGGKGCCVPWKPYQTQAPTPEELDSWFGPGNEGRNLALVTGAFHKLVIVDADDEESVRFARLQFGPTPYRVRTRRGMHFYFRHPGINCHVQTKAKVFGEQGPAIDVRGDGGQCTGLGSIHASGFVYRLDDGADQVSVLDLPPFDPSWVPAPKPVRPPELYRGPQSLDAVNRAERYLAKIQGTGKGGRNHHTFSVAAAVVRDFGLTLEQGWALMSNWNQASNDPPLAEDELKVIVQSCLRSGRSPLGSKLQGVM